MIPFEKIKTIFFDYDGTLHKSIEIYAPAFRKSYDFLVNNGFAQPREWSDTEITAWLGFNPNEMWKAFMPELEESIKTECSKIIGSEMIALIEARKPILYPGALEVLSYLRDRDIMLVFISNCKKYYMDSHTKLFNLKDYFTEMACSEDYDFLPKHQILQQIKDRYAKEMVIIGDRNQDIEAGIRNKMYTIGCSYGYANRGELDLADFIINDIRSLKEFF